MKITRDTLKDIHFWRRIFEKILFYILVAIFLIVILLPLYYIFLTTMSPSLLVFTKPLRWIPSKITFQLYINVFRDIPVATYFLNTTALSVTSTVLATFVSFLAAYSISKCAPPGANLFLVGLMASSMVPAVATVIPLFQMFKVLNLLNTFTGLLILYGAFMLPVTTWVLVNVFRSIPNEIEDSARIDGANTLQLIFLVMLPIAQSGIATMLIINFIAAWNTFLIPLIFANGPKSKVITQMIYEAGRMAANPTNNGWLINVGQTMAAGIITTIPVFILALIFQRQVVEGISGGVYK